MNHQLQVERFFPNFVPGWLHSLAAEPREAVQDLLVGRADLGHLSAGEPVEILLDWCEGIDADSGFVEQVDEGLAGWIDAAWGIPALEAAAGSAALTAEAWCRAGILIANEPRLTRAAQRLRDRFLAQPGFLRALSEGRARDPEGWAWEALARHQDDRSLLGRWQRLCELPSDVPWHHGATGIAGLRGLPAASPHYEGTFPTEVAAGLAHLASALARRTAEGGLREKTAREEFQRTARRTMAAYPWPERWLAFWRRALAGGRLREATAGEWIRALLPQLDASSKAEVRGRASVKDRDRYRGVPTPVSYVAEPPTASYDEEEDSSTAPPSSSTPAKSDP